MNAQYPSPIPGKTDRRAATGQLIAASGNAMSWSAYSPDTMRIALVTNALFRADGIGQAALDVGRGLVTAGHELHLVYPVRDYEQPRLNDWAELAEGLVPVGDLSLRRSAPLRTAAAILGAARALRRLRPDLIYVHQPAHAVLGAIAAAGRATTLTMHLHGHPSPSPGWAQRVGVRRAQHIIGVSQSVTAAWQPHGADPGRCRVIHNGIDLHRFSPATPSERRAAKQRLGLSPHAPVVGFVGRLTEAKGVHVLAEAFVALTADRPDAQLLMVGATEAHGAARAALEQELTGTNATILDAQDDPRPTIAAFDVGVVPSDMEAFSLVVLELMASAVPVLGSAVGGTPEALGPELSTRLTAHGDAAALAEQLRGALDNLDDRGFAAAYRARAEGFDAEQWRAEMVDFLTRPAD